MSFRDFVDLALLIMVPLLWVHQRYVHQQLHAQIVAKGRPVIVQRHVNGGKQ